jgi:alpha-N-arabinofuranosidase
VAAVHFHHFQDHPERVRMANIAQTVNVLQAMVLTDGARMLLTPTYHVFRMFKVHHDATALSMAVETPELAWNEQKYPALTASASRDASGKIHLSLSNASLDTAAKVRCLVRGAAVTRATGEVLAAEAMDAHNTFDLPESVKPRPLTNMTVKEGVLEMELPPKAVAVVELT